MKYIAKVPLRVSFFGGGTDIPPYCNEHGGEILYCTINRYAYCEIEPIPEQNRILLGDADEIYQDGDEQYIGKWGVVKAVLHELTPKKGCRIKIYSDVLPGTGLGGSSAQIAAVILACYHWENKEISKRELAKQTYYIERTVMKIKGGYQDPITTVYGGIGYLKVYDIENFKVESLKLEECRIQRLKEYLLLYYTGIQHNSSVIMDDHVKIQIKDKRKLEKILDAIKALADEAKVLLERGDIVKFGAMLHRGWEQKKKMSGQVSNDYIDQLYEKVKNEGVSGGKILGAGGGGYLLLFLPPVCRQKVIGILAEERGETDINWEIDLAGARIETYK